MVNTLKGRISAIYLVLVVISAIIGFTAIINVYKVNRSIDGIMIDNYKSIKVITQMQETIERQNYAILKYLVVDSKQGLDEFFITQKRFQKLLNIENNNITEIGEKPLVEKLNANYQEYAKFILELQEIKHTKGLETAISFNDSVIRSKSKQIEAYLKELAELNEKAMYRSKNKAINNAKKSLNLIFIVSLATVSIGFLAAKVFVNRFFKPVNLLIETVKLVKEGDLNQQAQVVYHDEIGELAAEFNHLTQRLLQYEQSSVGKLMSEKNRTLVIVKSISDPLIVLDRNFRLELINKVGEELFGIKENDSRDRHFLEVIRNGELFDHIVAEVEEKNEPRQKIILIKSKTSDFYFNVLVNVVRDEQFIINGIIVLLQNITQIKQLEKIKTDFIATVSHEFKTPLTSVMIGLSLLLEEKLGSLNEKQTKTLNTIREDGESLVNLVNDLLEISKIESAKSIFKTQTCSIYDLIKNTIEKFGEKLEGRMLNFFEDKDLPGVNIDPDKIQWVLVNLIGNALKYTDSGDQITVSTAVNQDKLCISVKDTGTGIPQEYVDKVFEKFFQIKGYDLEMRGSGLGLAIVKEIVEAHGGEIWCESKLNEGSTFIFTLPLNKGELDEKSVSS